MTGAASGASMVAWRSGCDPAQKAVPSGQEAEDDPAYGEGTVMQPGTDSNTWLFFALLRFSVLLGRSFQGRLNAGLTPVLFWSANSLPGSIGCQLRRYL